VGVVTPMFVETDMTMVAPKVVGTLAPTAGVNVCVIYACEEDCNDCDDIEALVLADFVILFKALPLRKCTHKDADFP
jgi:hypothetical protein